jgi:hypothetical protein
MKPLTHVCSLQPHVHTHTVSTGPAPYPWRAGFRVEGVALLTEVCELSVLSCEVVRSLPPPGFPVG